MLTAAVARELSSVDRRVVSFNPHVIMGPSHGTLSAMPPGGYFLFGNSLYVPNSLQWIYFWNMGKMQVLIKWTGAQRPLAILCSVPGQPVVWEPLHRPGASHPSPWLWVLFLRLSGVNQGDPWLSEGGKPLVHGYHARACLAHSFTFLCLPFLLLSYL